MYNGGHVKGKPGRGGFLHRLGSFDHASQCLTHAGDDFVPATRNNLPEEGVLIDLLLDGVCKRAKNADFSIVSSQMRLRHFARIRA